MKVQNYKQHETNVLFYRLNGKTYGFHPQTH